MKDPHLINDIEIDTETKGRNFNKKSILSLQLGFGEHQVVIDCRHYSPKVAAAILEDTSIKKYLHNAKFDYKFLLASGVKLENVYDTMLAECVIYCGIPKAGYALDVTAKRRVDVILNKETRGEFYLVESEPFTEEQIMYAARDVMHLINISKEQQKLITKYNLQYALDLENKAVLAIADMEYNGVHLDPEKWKQLTHYNEQLLAEVTIELDNLLLESPIANQLPRITQTNLFEEFFNEKSRILDINYDSHKQTTNIANLLGYDVEALPDNILSKLVKQHKFFELLRRYRGIAKAVSTYGLSFLDNIDPITKRVHTEFWQILNTYRLSSNSPNMQNIPKKKEYRNCFVTRPGYKWVSIDYSAQELRVMADYSNEKSFIDVLNRGEDLHCFAGSLMFGRTITKEDKELRNSAKTINFGKPYGMGPPKLADTLSISLEEADNLFKMYAKTFPSLEKWLNSQAAFGVNNGYIRLNSVHNGIRWFPEYRELVEGKKQLEPNWSEIYKYKGTIERASMNTPIQGTGAVIVKEALVETRELLKKYDGYMLLQVHDEINFEIREDQVDQFVKEAEKVMIDCGNKYVTKVEMGVETTVSDYWTK